jgi:beta-glucosidase
LNVGHDQVTFTVKNTGKRAGVEIAEVYATLPASAGEPWKRLVGWQRVPLAAGEAKTVTVTLESRALSVWDETKHAWSRPAGTYGVMVGASSDAPALKGELHR